MNELQKAQQAFYEAAEHRAFALAYLRRAQAAFDLAEQDLYEARLAAEEVAK